MSRNEDAALIREYREAMAAMAAVPREYASELRPSSPIFKAQDRVRKAKKAIWNAVEPKEWTRERAAEGDESDEPTSHSSVR